MDTNNKYRQKNKILYLSLQLNRSTLQNIGNIIVCEWKALLLTT
ncbi:unnamed protein product [Paramecium primaurelia]|uniref:Uncharacterized protein n=1 Tax=Paramecium primaurelia TaxID=5886 RepID=A0A8S1LDH6_PARPR|nr:unnamed protein product [Paramecium primaurelia]